MDTSQSPFRKKIDRSSLPRTRHWPTSTDSNGTRRPKLRGNDKQTWSYCLWSDSTTISTTTIPALKQSHGTTLNDILHSRHVSSTQKREDHKGTFAWKQLWDFMKNQFSPRLKWAKVRISYDKLEVAQEKISTPEEVFEIGG